MPCLLGQCTLIVLVYVLTVGASLYLSLYRYMHVESPNAEHRGARKIARQFFSLSRIPLYIETYKEIVGTALAKRPCQTDDMRSR